jgi:hypothetical protein
MKGQLSITSKAVEFAGELESSNQINLPSNATYDLSEELIYKEKLKRFWLNVEPNLD